ncbi:MAG: O-antigen ligase family protein [Candidatus Daviesbacteria bacterium]|nr:MAG: O-antigen ligase family protein [Candidatus Daviesbacteria bacterium]
MQKLSFLCRKYLIWWVYFLFVFIPLYPKFPLISVPGTYVAVRLEDFIVAVVFLWWLISKVGSIGDSLKQPLYQAFILFWAVGALSVFSGILVTHTVSWHLSILHFLRRVEVMILFFVALDAVQNLNQIKNLLKISLLTTLIIIFYGFGQQWFSFPVISTMNKEFSKGLILFLTPGARVNSTFAGHYDLAVYLSVFLIFATAFLFYVRKLKEKLLILFSSLLGFILLSLTAARVSFLSTILGAAAVLWFVGQRKLIFLLILLSLGAFVISPDLRHRTVATVTVNLLGGGGAKYSPPPQKPNPTKHFSIENAASSSATFSGIPVDVAPGEPINSTELGVFRSFEIRLNVEWPRAVRAFFKNPFLGSGYSSITIATDNDYLRSLGETGMLGFLSFALIWWIILRTIWKKRPDHKNFTFYLLTASFVGVLVIFINSTFIDALESSKISFILWLVLGASVALVKFKHD